jgi:hypothetical protein
MLDDSHLWSDIHGVSCFWRDINLLSAKWLYKTASFPLSSDKQDKLDFILDICQGDTSTAKWIINRLSIDDIDFITSDKAFKKMLTGSLIYEDNMELTKFIIDKFGKLSIASEYDDSCLGCIRHLGDLKWVIRTFGRFHVDYIFPLLHACKISKFLACVFLREFPINTDKNQIGYKIIEYGLDDFNEDIVIWIIQLFDIKRSMIIRDLTSPYHRDINYIKTIFDYVKITKPEIITAFSRLLYNMMYNANIALVKFICVDHNINLTTLNNLDTTDIIDIIKYFHHLKSQFFKPFLKFLKFTKSYFKKFDSSYLVWSDINVAKYIIIRCGIKNITAENIIYIANRDKSDDYRLTTWLIGRCYWMWKNNNTTKNMIIDSIHNINLKMWFNKFEIQ